MKTDKKKEPASNTPLAQALSTFVTASNFGMVERKQYTINGTRCQGKLEKENYNVLGQSASRLGKRLQNSQMRQLWGTHQSATRTNHPDYGLCQPNF